MHFKNRLFSVGGLLIIALLVTLVATIPLFSTSTAQAQSIVAPADSANLQISNSRVQYRQDWDVLIFKQQVTGKAGETIPTANGELDGAPVLGYVFPTTLASNDVGFGNQDGIVALAVTSHPDFDDTPLWDENNDGNYENDGRVYHSHWVLLEKMITWREDLRLKNIIQKMRVWSYRQPTQIWLCILTRPDLPYKPRAISYG